jgi:hypothetical protein
VKALERWSKALKPVYLIDISTAGSPMAAPVVTVGAAADLSLSQIGTVVAQQENLLEPLVSIGNDGSQTLLTFDLERDPPETPAVIGIGNPPPGSIALAKGKIFVSGQLQDVLAFRPE